MNHEQFYVTSILAFLKEAVLWIRIGFNGEPDRSFHLKADPDPDPGSPPHAYLSGSGSWSDFAVTKSRIYKKNIPTYVGISLLKRLEIRFIYRFGQFPCFCIRIRIPIKDPIWIHKRQINADPRGSGSESGSTTMGKSKLTTQNATCLISPSLNSACPNL